MGVVKVKKALIILPRDIKAKMLEHLQDKGVLHIDSIEDHSPEIEPSSPAPVTEIERLVSEMKTGAEFLRRYSDEKINFVQSFFEFKYLVDRDYVDNIDDHLKELREVVERCKGLDAEISALKKDLTEAESHKKEVDRLLSASNFALSALEPTTHTKGVVGVVGKKDMEDILRERWEDTKSGLRPFIREIGTVGKDRVLMARFLKRDESVVMTKLLQHKFHPFSLPKDTLCKRCEPLSKYRQMDLETYAKALEQVIKDIKSAIDEREEVGRALSRNYMVKVLAAHDVMVERIRRGEVESHVGESERTVMIVGWVKKDDAEDLRASIRSSFPQAAVLLEDPGKDDNPPTAIENNRIARPFEIITSMYSMPLYRELDPTPYLAPFFLLFFPLCLSDAGYGIMLLALSWIVMKKVQMGYDGRRLFNILIMCSLVTIVVGALMGSWFGLPKEMLPQFLKDIVLLDPLDPKGIMTFLLLCFIIGIVQSIYVGYGIDIYKKVRNRDFTSAILDDVVALVFLTFLILFALMFLGMRPYVYHSTTITYGFTVSAIGLFITQARLGEGLVGKLGSGVWGLYTIGIGAIGDILSYSRLLALGLVTSAIGLVFNTMAFMIRDAVPVIGVVLMLIVMFIASMFNVIISSLGGFVHTMRLQYVEFFSKFYSGGGVAFEPFRKEYKNIHVRHTEEEGAES